MKAKNLNGDNFKDIADFGVLFNKYYTLLCLVAEHIVRSRSDAEEIVMDMFLKLWNCRDKVIINSSVKAYLLKSVQNTAINFLEQNKYQRYADSLTASEYKLLAWDSDYPLGQLYEHEILEILDTGIKSLPEACREIFSLSREDNLKYCDIAARLGISVNTVKTQMKIALRHLRVHLKDYITAIVTLLISAG